MYKSKLMSVDILRGIAAFGVYYSHQHIGNIISTFTGIDLFSYTDIFGFTYAVPLFFILSGYCIHRSSIRYIREGHKLPLLKYFRNRILRIFPLYLMALVFSIWTNSFTNYSHFPSIKDLVIHAFSLQGFSVESFNTINVVLWTITIELALYSLYPIFFFLRQKYGIYKSMAAVFLISVTSIIYLHTKNSITLPERFFVTNLWFSWCTGAVLCDIQANSIKPKIHNVYKLLYLFIILGFILLPFINWKNDFLVKDEFNILIWIGPLSYVISKENFMQKYLQNKLRIFVLIGVSSYSLYLFHSPLIDIKNYLINQYFSNHKFIFMGLGVFLIPALCYFITLILEKPLLYYKSQLNRISE